MPIGAPTRERFNPAAPGPIGTQTPGAITGTTITATEQFLAPDGSVGAPAYSFSGNPTMGMRRSNNNNIEIYPSGGGGRLVVSPGGRIQAQAGVFFGSSSSAGLLTTPSLEVVDTFALQWSATSAASLAKDTELYRDDAGILAQRSGTTAQSNRIYGTFTDASNYERLALKTTAGSKVTVAAETAGTGADNLDLELVPAGTGVVQFSNPQDGAGAASGTLTNAPSAGNPSDWIKVKIGANVRYIPAWT